jgi:hypothetical protein
LGLEDEEAIEVSCVGPHLNVRRIAVLTASTLETRWLTDKRSGSADLGTAPNPKPDLIINGRCYVSFDKNCSDWRVFNESAGLRGDGA